MAKDAPDLLVHKEWLGQIQQVGLVVSPYVLQKHGVGIDREQSLRTQTALRALASDTEEARVTTFHELAGQVLEWPASLLAGAEGGPDLPDTLTVALPEYDDRLSASYALKAPDSVGWLLLVMVAPTGADLDRPLPDQKDGWRASPHARLERLLRETGVPIGLLFSHTHLRLVYAPRGESSGHLTFRFKHLLETLGRPMAGALFALLGERRVTDALPDAERLRALLQESRKYQNVVSTRLAEQVLEALWHLLRGFQRANDDTKGALLASVLREHPQDVYGGLLTTLMRLVFILYAEDRGLMPGSDVYQKHYAVSGLFERLREDAARYPDTMDARFGAWAQLLALFRLIHDGGGHRDLHFPPRHGRLFSPDAYPFLEGRARGATRVMGDAIDPPRVPDGTVFRVLQNLLVLDGERLSYRALDVEQIGSVYEAMMGFALQQAAGPAVAVKPKHIVVNLADLLEQPAKERAAWLAKHAELKLAGDALAKAVTTDGLLTALGTRLSKQYTPAPLPPGAMFLQPTEERRRSGSHYTPRSLTQPIVATTFRPIFEHLGERATPEQILDLKMCDPAMGSGAFLVEACRLLAERLVRAWEMHGVSPKVPDDEDVLTYARRLVAERCLYGVDKNIFAVDLAKLSLWLATLAKEHPFTFLDHALRHGDSLVGLTRDQLASFHWEEGGQLPLLRTLLDARVAEAQRLRERIQGMATSDDVPEKARLLREADEKIDDVRQMGDLVVSAFFERDNPKARLALRAAHFAHVQRWVDAGGGRPEFPEASVRGFHWPLEFPEVFTRSNAGFDACIGNPPFLGGTRISEVLGMTYFRWLVGQYPPSEHHCDLVAYFFRRADRILGDVAATGFVATNTIGQGDTREGGLAVLLARGARIYSASRRVRWPGNAAVVVSIVHLLKGAKSRMAQLDGRNVQRISAYLLEGATDSSPARLGSSPYFSLGSKIYGQGFLFDDADEKASSISAMRDLLRSNPECGQRILPYIGGEELNTSPSLSHRRYAIFLSDLSSEQNLAAWQPLKTIVEAKVKPERNALGSNPNNVPLKRRWWAYQAHRPELYALLAGQQRVLALSRVGQHLAFAFLPTGMIYSEALVLFAIHGHDGFAVVQSRVHEGWARMFSSTLKDDLRYTPSDCFETFPFPPSAERHSHDVAGREYYEYRSSLMLEHNEGLTGLYNRFHDPSQQDDGVIRLRDLHSAMDRAVLDAYGWTDIPTTCEFILDHEDDEDDEPGKASKKRKPWRYRWPDEVRDEVLSRLLALNSARAGVASKSLGSSPGGNPIRQKGKTQLPLDVLLSADQGGD